MMSIRFIVTLFTSYILSVTATLGIEYDSASYNHHQHEVCNNQRVIEDNTYHNNAMKRSRQRKSC